MKNPVYRAPKPKTPQHLMPGTVLTGQGLKSSAATGPPGAGAKQVPIKEVLGDALRCLEQEGVEAVCGYLEKLAGAQGRTAVAMPQRLTTLASLVQQKDPKSALLLAQKAIAMDEENMAAWMLAGSLQDRLGDRKASAQAMRRVVRSPLTKPDQVVRAANLLVRFGDQQEALDSAKAAFDKLGRPIHLASALMYIARLTADWVRVDELKAQMGQAYAKGQCAEVGESPRTHLLWCGDEATNIKVVKNWSERSIRLPQQVNAPKPEPLEGRRIRVGYLSSDFRDHPTSRLINGLFRHHDRSKFELFMYCSSWDDKSEMRREIESHFDHRQAVAHLSDEAAAQLIRSHGIDVLVELNGPTRAHRMGILAHRPAPVQIDYLGWPGSVGGRVVDYIIGDDYTVPPEMEALYPEKVIKLSKTYQINDFASRTLPGKPSKQAVGLPAGEHLILGMFNAINKVDGSVWDAWMRIMRSVPNSLLWMLDPGPVARQMIAQATQKCGVDAKRIVIAPRLKQEAHLARMQCCDLMLDPWPYGGHTSTSDALFARVPVIALQGTNFASRVSGGLLSSAGMGVMVQPDVDSYVSKAIELLSKPVMLEQAKKYLRERVPKSDLFDAVGKSRKLEENYIKILNEKYNIKNINFNKVNDAKNKKIEKSSIQHGGNLEVLEDALSKKIINKYVGTLRENIEGVYINLDESVGRKEKMEELLKKRELNTIIQRFPAIHGGSLSESLDKITKSELGCLLSHVSVMNKQTINKYLIVLEDDVKLTKDFEKLLSILRNQLENEMKHVDMIFLGQTINFRDVNRVKRTMRLKRKYENNNEMGMGGEVMLLDGSEWYKWGMFAYILNKNSGSKVSKILESNSPHGLPIDDLIRKIINEKMITAKVAFPYLVGLNNVETTINDRRQNSDVQDHIDMVNLFLHDNDLDELFKKSIEMNDKNKKHKREYIYSQLILNKILDQNDEKLKGLLK